MQLNELSISRAGSASSDLSSIISHKISTTQESIGYLHHSMLVNAYI